uniref:Uncharacterized protein n=1 Tax=Sphaeramia orbicularis TaxID=375764 RepID=A0A672Z396_9TELE
MFFNVVTQLKIIDQDYDRVKAQLITEQSNQTQLKAQLTQVTERLQKVEAQLLYVQAQRTDAESRLRYLSGQPPGEEVRPSSAQPEPDLRSFTPSLHGTATSREIHKLITFKANQKAILDKDVELQAATLKIDKLEITLADVAARPPLEEFLKLQLDHNRANSLLEQAHIKIQKLDDKVNQFHQERTQDLSQIVSLKSQLLKAQDSISQLQQQNQQQADELNKTQKELLLVRQLKLEESSHTPLRSPPSPVLVDSLETIKPSRPSQPGPSWEAPPSLHVTVNPTVQAAYAPTSTTPQGVSVLSEPKPQSSMSVKDLDKIARNISHFEPKPNGSHDTAAYLKDIDFHLERYPNATLQDKIYLIKITSSREVKNFIDRQPAHVQSNFQALCQALTKEFEDPGTATGLSAAIAIKQGRQEPPQVYYARLRKAYFGARNEPEMEEDPSFKALFVENLHPNTSHQLGVAACPKTLNSSQLRDLAAKGFAKLKKSAHRPSDPAVFNLTRHATIEPKGGPQTYPDNGQRPESRPFPKNKGQTSFPSDQRRPFQNGPYRDNQPRLQPRSKQQTNQRRDYPNSFNRPDKERNKVSPTEKPWTKSTTPGVSPTENEKLFSVLAQFFRDHGYDKKGRSHHYD